MSHCGCVRNADLKPRDLVGKQGRVDVFSSQSIAIALAVSLALAYSTQSGQLVRHFVDAGSVRGLPYLRASLASLSDALVMLVLASVAARRSPRSVVAFTGLGAPTLGPVLWSLLLFLPAVGICFAAADLAAGTRVEDVLWKAIGGPFVEEFVYRGLAVGLLMRLCGWPLLAACLWPAVFFGVAHAGQGSDLGSILGIVAITGAGGLLFGWLFVRWGFNIWPPILLHVGMNALWLLFDLGENAIGGWFGNVLRLGIVVLAVVSTFWFAPPKPKLTAS